MVTLHGLNAGKEHVVWDAVRQWRLDSFAARRVKAAMAAMGGEYKRRIAAGNGFSVLLSEDGRSIKWSGDRVAEWGLPEEAHGDFVAVAAGLRHCLALCVDGTVRAWGRNAENQAPPAGVKGPFVAVSAGGSHSMGLLDNGDVECWGSDEYGQAPSLVIGPFKAIAAGCLHSMALREDGSVAFWGWNGEGRAPPAGTALAELEGPFTAIACGGVFSLALRPDGSVKCWGNNREGAAPPAGVRGPFSTIAAGGCYSAGLLRESGEAQCWVNIDEPPPGRFDATAAGSFNVLGLRPGGTTEEWHVPEP